VIINSRFIAAFRIVKTGRNERKRRKESDVRSGRLKKENPL